MFEEFPLFFGYLFKSKSTFEQLSAIFERVSPAADSRILVVSMDEMTDYLLASLRISIFILSEFHSHFNSDLQGRLLLFLHDLGQRFELVVGQQMEQVIIQVEFLESPCGVLGNNVFLLVLGAHVVGCV